ncbi:hypothetical protein BGZ73_008735 [Actinomortierella ambigua]|nr:hypothetical protein BGZ73_008735 [Actinomortierella ambigua]
MFISSFNVLPIGGGQPHVQPRMLQRNGGSLGTPLSSTGGNRNSIHADAMSTLSMEELAAYKRNSARSHSGPLGGAPTTRRYDEVLEEQTGETDRAMSQIRNTGGPGEAGDRGEMGETGAEEILVVPVELPRGDDDDADDVVKEEDVRKEPLGRCGIRSASSPLNDTSSPTNGTSSFGDNEVATISVGIRCTVSACVWDGEYGGSMVDKGLREVLWPGMPAFLLAPLVNIRPSRAAACRSISFTNSLRCVSRRFRRRTSKKTNKPPKTTRAANRPPIHGRNPAAAVATGVSPPPPSVLLPSRPVRGYDRGKHNVRPPTTRLDITTFKLNNGSRSMTAAAERSASNVSHRRLRHCMYDVQLW